MAGRTCKDCAYYAKASQYCSEWRMSVAHDTPECKRFLPAVGRNDAIKFKPMFTVRILEEPEGSEADVAAIDPETFEAFVRLYNDPDVKVETIKEKLRLNGAVLVRYMEHAQEKGLIVKRSQKWKRGSTSMKSSETKAAAPQQAQVKPAGEPSAIDVQELSDEALRELARRIREEAGTRFLRGA